ncbi:MAG: rod-binding protein [Rhodobacteraceae bacterium]|nr:rod-binding protein [Paracoccaceae bacterium]
MDLPPITPKPTAPQAERTAPAVAAERAARETAQAFEAAFLAEMLKHSGVNRTPETDGGGAGEDAFASFLTGEYASLVAERGGVGLAEQIFKAIYQKDPGT